MIEVPLPENVYYENYYTKIRFSSFPHTMENKDYYSNLMTSKDVLLLTPSNSITEEDLIIFRQLNYHKQCIVLCNEPEEKELCSMYKIYSCNVNNNAFLDENIYKIDNNIDKKFDAIYVTKPDLYKRIELCEDLENLALIGNWKTDEKFTTNKHTILNTGFTIDPDKMYQYYNQAYCSLSLSHIEGSSYSSSESLLCGLPVISTPSLGGRHIWYDENNSIIVNDNKESVALAVKDCLDNLKSGFFNPDKIRKNHIKKMQWYRDQFCKVISLITKEKVNDCRHIFKERFHNKMLKYYI